MKHEHAVSLLRRRLHDHAADGGIALIPGDEPALARILSGEIAWTPADALDGGEDQARDMAARRLVALWTEHPGGLQVTLSSGVAAMLGAVIHCDRAKVVYLPDGKDADAVTRSCLEEPERWCEIDQLPCPVMPRVRGFAPLPIPERVVAREPGPLEEAAQNRQLEILSVIVEVMRAKPTKAKKARKKKARKKAGRRR